MEVAPQCGNRWILLRKLVKSSESTLRCLQTKPKKIVLKPTVRRMKIDLNSVLQVSTSVCNYFTFAEGLKVLVGRFCGWCNKVGGTQARKYVQATTNVPIFFENINTGRQYKCAIHCFIKAFLLEVHLPPPPSITKLPTGLGDP